MNMFEEIKGQNLVMTFPRSNMQRLMVEVFRIEDGIFFFDVGWPECDSGHPTHFVDGKIRWVKDHWEIDSKDYGLVTVEPFSREKHPRLIMNNDTWGLIPKNRGRG